MDQLSVPEDLQSFITVESDTDKFIITIPYAKDHPKELVPWLIKTIQTQSDETAPSEEKLEIVLRDMLGNQGFHTAKAAQNACFIRLIIDPEKKSCDVIATGYADDASRQRMSNKFSAATALSKEDADHHLQRVMASGFKDGVTPITKPNFAVIDNFWDSTDNEPLQIRHGSDISEKERPEFLKTTGGIGLLLQYAYSEGPMKLTFFPDETLAAENAAGESCSMQRFVLENALCLGTNKGKISNITTQGRVRSFFPHVESGAPTL